MGKVYWILGLMILTSVGWGYAIRITTLDYLNRYQNSQQQQQNTNQGSTSNNQNTQNNQNTNSQNSNNNGQNVNPPNPTDGSTATQSNTNTSPNSNNPSWDPNAIDNASLLNDTINGTIADNSTKGEEPVLYAYWVEGAAQTNENVGNGNEGKSALGNQSNTTNSSEA